MSTFIDNTNVADVLATQMLAVAAVLTAFPATTLSGAAAKRFTTALLGFQTTPANGHIKDELGDVLAVCFVAQNPYGPYLLTNKGKARLSMEQAASQGL